MWDLIVSVPDHCLSFYFKIPLAVYATDRSKAAILESFLFCMALWFLLKMFHVESFLALYSHVFIE